jgi:signal transduction histidine kinase
MTTATKQSRRRLPRPSIRTRLTLWYAGLLAFVLAVLAAVVLGLTANRLQADMDARLFNTARDIAGAIERQLAARQVIDPVIQLQEVAPGLGSFTSRGLLIQIVDADGRVASRSEAAPGSAMLPPPTGAAGPVASRADRVVNGWPVRVVEYPLILREGPEETRPVGSVLVAERTATLAETLASLRQVLAWTSLGGVALAAGGGWLLAGRALRPVDRITGAAAAIAADGSPASLATRLPSPTSPDELGRLATTFNAMLDRIQASFETQRRFVADASHELRTPLAAIRGNTEVMLRQAASLPEGVALRDDLAAAAEDVRRESTRMARLLDDLLLLARADAAVADQPGSGALRQPLVPVRLDEVAREAARTASMLAGGQEVTVSGPPVATPGDRDRLLQVLLILLDNAVRHTSPGGLILVQTGFHGRERVAVAVHDTGPGIAPEHLPRLFDRFYRIDDARGRATGGVGLGLAIAEAIVRAHQGDIVVASQVGRGSVFTVRLPAHPLPVEEAPAPLRLDAGALAREAAPPRLKTGSVSET